MRISISAHKSQILQAFGQIVQNNRNEKFLQFLVIALKTNINMKTTINGPRNGKLYENRNCYAIRTFYQQQKAILWIVVTCLFPFIL